MSPTHMTDAHLPHEFLHEAYDRLHDSPMQQKLRRIRPWPVGCVFIEHPGMTEADIRGHFRLMRELGFTALKQCQTCAGTDNRAVMHMALDEGIIPWWYGEGGWEDPTPAHLASLGIAPGTPIAELRQHPIWLSRQERIMRDRIDGKPAPPPVHAGPRPEVPGVQLSFDFELEPAHLPLFMAWLRRSYTTIDALNRAWNTHHSMISGPRDAERLAADGVGWRSWEDLEAELLPVANGERREYRRIRDVLRFKADVYLDHVRANAETAKRHDANAPSRAGGEMGLFLPFASRGTDMEGIAEVMREYGSFYPSFHLAWHFEEVDFETVRPFYMQASITADWFKGGWNASWEATGGPQQMTGHKAPFVPKVRELTPGFTVDAGIMTQLMLSWIAGGYRGFGLWCWTVRSAGWEAGEFGLLDRLNQPTDRARVAGRIGAVCRTLRDELWAAKKEPLVGVFQDWDMEAIWAAASRGGRDFFKNQPIRARIGASRALMNANVPWEHVTASDLRAGLASRYPAIILPAALSISVDLLDILYAYVSGGGRLILDAPGAWFDEYGQLLSTREGSAFERLFGCRIADYQYSRTGNRPWCIEGRQVSGCTFDLQPTGAAVLASFDHGPPAITAHSVGSGLAILIGYEATLACTLPGGDADEALLVALALGDRELPYSCDEALVYRLAAPGADHYFLLNDGAARSVRLHTPGYSYSTATDPISGDPVDLQLPVELHAHSGRWLRCRRG